MTDIFRSPEKVSMKAQLFSIAVETLENAGRKVERVQGTASQAFSVSRKAGRAKSSRSALHKTGG
jgi:hypothetical protein